MRKNNTKKNRKKTNLKKIRSHFGPRLKPAPGPSVFSEATNVASPSVHCGGAPRDPAIFL